MTAVERMRRAVAAAIVLCAIAGPVRADQTDSRLAGLFADLRAASDRDAAGAVEAQIWAIWLQPANPAVAADLAAGTSAMEAGDFGAAEAAFSRVVTTAPDFAEGWNKRATALYLEGRYADSIKDIGRVLALEPRHFGALSGLGLCNVQLNQDRAALNAFERAAEVDPKMAGVQANIELLKTKIARESI